jgi:hypothetical protein
MPGKDCRDDADAQPIVLIAVSKRHRCTDLQARIFSPPGHSPDINNIRPGPAAIPASIV